MGTKSEENPADLNVIQRQNAEEAEKAAKKARDAQSEAQGQPKTDA